MARQRKGDQSLRGRTLYIPSMSVEGTEAMAAALRSIGIQAEMSPESDERTLELGGRYTSGDECYPERVTLGNFLKVIESEDFKPEKTAFMLATAGGPCRFGQYTPYLKKVLKDLGHEDVPVWAPTSSNGYGGVDEYDSGFIRLAWWGLVCADILRKLTLKTRPYEREKGETDDTHRACLDALCRVLEDPTRRGRDKFNDILKVMENIRDRFRAVPATWNRNRLLIGIVGEIFCRLDEFSNDYMVRRIEEQGGEVFLSDISEWIWYTNAEHKKRLISSGGRFSLGLLEEWIKQSVQKRDEKKLYRIFGSDFKGYEEPEDIEQILEYSSRYLPPSGCLGEMVLNVGGAIYFYHKGADGVVDISPFTCMNGIVCEAVYPNVSRDHDNFPVRNFYFDGTQTDIETDVGIFLELARTYRSRKRVARIFPQYFHDSTR
jgi:predicted nucleotide-binding protein (sugar kinase/HSP70/actin superfamily)